MTRLEYLPTKEYLIKKYYSWLLDSNDIKLEKEIDICLPVSDKDCFIYYPEIIADLFHNGTIADYVSLCKKMQSTFQIAEFDDIEL